MEEDWRVIECWSGYEVSNLGRVRRKKDGKILKQYLQKSGYVYVWLNRGYGNTAHPVHRLVCNAFHDNPEDKPFVDHIDTNRSNNRADNLRWATPLENSNNETTRYNMRARYNRKL